MSGSPDPTFVMLGLSGTGKTNFLVALDVVLDDQTDPDGLIHSDLAADRAYLQPLKEQWLKGEQFLKTSRQERPPPHHLLVKHQASDARAGLYLPDLAGETFDSQFVTRSLPIDYCNRLEQAVGYCSFCIATTTQIMLSFSTPRWWIPLLLNRRLLVHGRPIGALRTPRTKLSLWTCCNSSPKSVRGCARFVSPL